MGHMFGRKKFEQLKELKFEHEVREIHFARAIHVNSPRLSQFIWKSNKLRQKLVVHTFIHSK